MGIVQLVKFLPCKHKDLGSFYRKCLKTVRKWWPILVNPLLRDR